MHPAESIVSLLLALAVMVFGFTYFLPPSLRLQTHKWFGGKLSNLGTQLWKLPFVIIAAIFNACMRAGRWLSYMIFTGHPPPKPKKKKKRRRHP